MKFVHQPVMLKEAIALLVENNGKRFVDATLGGGGHSRYLLETLPEAEVLGIDRDIQAINAAAEKLKEFGNRFHYKHGKFSGLKQYIEELGWEKTDGILFDLGVSSAQIDNPKRGFSFRFDAPLDMRMNRDEELTAAKLLNEKSQEELEKIIREYGEERKARAIARRIVERRKSKAWENTTELSELLEKVVGRRNQYGLPPATRTFQALRIAVNEELSEIEEALKSSLEVTAKGARIVLISFHSLEDRMVKSFFSREAASCVCPPTLPICVCGKNANVKVLTKKPLYASEDERRENSRSKSAKLRAAERL